MIRGTDVPSRPRGRVEAGPGAVLQILRAEGECDARRVMQVSRLARATVETRLETLVASGLVVQDVKERQTGRPPRVFSLARGAGLVVVARISLDHILVQVRDLAAEILVESRFEIPIEQGPGRVLGDLASNLRRMLLRERLAGHQVMAVGVGVPGAVDLSGEMARPPQPGAARVGSQWAHVHLADEIAAFLPALGIPSVPIVVANDAHFLALGAWLDSWPQTRNLLVVDAGDTLACGMVIDGVPLAGSFGMAADVAHIPRSGSPYLCTCGLRGCPSATMSGEGIAHQLALELGRQVTLVELAALITQRDARAIRVLTDGAHRLGEALGYAISLFDPDLVALGGRLVDLDPEIVNVVRREALGMVHPLTAAHTAVLASHSSDGTSLAGAAHMAIEAALAPEAIDEALAAGRTWQAAASREIFDQG